MNDAGSLNTAAVHEAARHEAARLVLPQRPRHRSFRDSFIHAIEDSICAFDEGPSAFSKRRHPEENALHIRHRSAALSPEISISPLRESAADADGRFQF